MFWSVLRSTAVVIAATVPLGDTIAGSHAERRTVPTRPLAEISYRAVGKLIYLPVRIDGGALRWFCFDSGAPDSIIDAATAREIGLEARFSGVIHGAGQGAVRADVAPPVRLTVGRLTTMVDRPRIVDLSHVPVPARQAGLLGVEFFERYVVRIDPERRRVSFYDPQSYRYAGGGAAIPLELVDRRLYVRLYLEPRPGQGQNRRLRVDTGSEDSVDDDTVKASATVTSTRLGNGLGTSYVGSSGVYSTVRIGPYAFHGIWGPAGAIPIIGMEMMRRFTLTFDAARRTLHLEPNRHLREPVPAPD